MNDPILIRREPKPLRTLYALVNYGALAALILWSTMGIEFHGIMQTARGTVDALLLGFILPDLEYLANWTKDGLPFAIVETVAISIAGTFASALLSIPVALLASQNIVGYRVSKLGKVLVTAIRTFPELILALIFISVVGPGAPAGILAIGIHSIGMLAKLFSEAIESMDMGVKEALDSCGATPMQVLFRAILPEVAPEFLSYTLYRFEINVRAAATLGLVGAGGIGAPLIFAIRSRAWPRVGIIMIVMVVV
ncbi:MAG TPA: phosphonate ABC transporter, permease protein PhnE, partial [Magnetospirillaceae bacterium]|nr:phosphonate ABC transporter, permease protein PhnE [Magnetospirillaceae bacterium]